jgi:hypothetical protein
MARPRVGRYTEQNNKYTEKQQEYLLVRERGMEKVLPKGSLSYRKFMNNVNMELSQ